MLKLSTIIGSNLYSDVKLYNSWELCIRKILNLNFRAAQAIAAHATIFQVYLPTHAMHAPLSTNSTQLQFFRLRRISPSFFLR